MRSVLSMITLCFFIATLFTVSMLAAVKAQDSTTFQLTPSDNPHVARLNSDQPYVAGFQVIKDDFSVYGGIDGMAVTVSFPSTNPESFSSGDWLGAGMFLQAQDTRFYHIDYGFYFMLVVDFSGNLYVDIGLHQTREASAPLQTPNEKTVYTYCWQLSGIDISTPVKLAARWDSNQTVHYSIMSGGFDLAVMSIDISSFADCENIIPKFYQGNVIVNPFPFSRYVNYFQFGVTSSRTMNNSNWQARLTEPSALKQAEWARVEKAWSTQGDISYLDGDWKWGGQPYEGVNAQYYNNPLQNSYELRFYYDGNTLPRGTELWDTKKATADEILQHQMHAHQVYASFLCALGTSMILICNILSEKHRHMYKCHDSYKNGPQSSKHQKARKLYLTHRPIGANHAKSNYISRNSSHYRGDSHL